MIEIKDFQQKFEKGSEEWMFFQDLYQTLQAFYKVDILKGIEDRKEFYALFEEQRKHLLEKYKYSELAKAGNDFLVSVIVNRDVGKEHECLYVKQIFVGDNA